MKQPILYTCPTCKVSYPTVSEAEACRDQFEDDGGWQIGDVLLIPQLIDYYSSQNHWLAYKEPAWLESASHFDHRVSYHHWFVVAGKLRDRWLPHRRLIVLYSGGAGRHHGFGWNPADGDGHHALYKPGEPMTGRWARSCMLHNEKYQDRPFVWLRKVVAHLRPPVGLHLLPEVREKIKFVQQKPNSVPLL